ncbi:cytochrome P450 monooxygenase-like protein [Cadophora sp. DSE1049]|nr:cytochrome P450 monooxygenase-like protein [Cadophora sp. DSE1049]
MSGIPFKPVTVFSAATSAFLVGFRPELLVFSQPSYVGTFLQIWVLSFSIWAFYKIVLYPRYFSPIRHFPTPPGGSWWNGHFDQIKALPTGGPMINWIESVPNDGIIRYMGMFNSERLFITSPKGLGEVLVTKNYDFIKPSHVATGLGRLLGIGVLLAEGDEHKRQRKNLMPAFAYRHVKDLVPVFWDKSREAVIAMTEHINAGGMPNSELPAPHKRPDVEKDDAVMEVGEWASRATLDIIGLAGMGQDFGAIKDPNTELNRTYRTVFKPSRQAAILGLLNIFLPGWFVRNLPVKRNGEIEAAAAVIRTTCRQLIRSKKDKLEKGELTDVDILSVALESGGFSEENLVDQLMTFLAAGHETTATAMTWAIYMLCLHPEVQTKLRAEIREKLPSVNGNEDVTTQDIDHMPYLNAVCNEVLRYYPPVPLTLRDAAQDTTILGQAVPKGTRVMMVPWAINKSKELWGPDGGKFNPDRWLPSEKNPHSANGGAQSNYSYLTFLHGPRSCIGQAFAKAEFMCLLAAWVGRFEFALNDERELDEKNVVIKGGVTAKPAKGLYVKTKVVDGW